MKEDVKIMTFTELYNLYSWVITRPINNNAQAKEVIKARITEIEEELYIRAFGFNPYKQRKPQEVVEAPQEYEEEGAE